MKKLVLLVSFFSIMYNYAQDYVYNPHEIRFNMGRFLATAALEGSYEYYFTEETTIGGTVFFNADPFARTGNFGIGPNLRAYFGRRPKSGLFAEAFGLYYTGKTKIEDNFGTRNNDYSNTAIGLGVGGKLSTFGEKFTVDFSVGLGRNLSQEEGLHNFIYRAGLAIGYRF